MPRTAFSAHLASAKSDLWGTPAALVDRLHLEFNIVLDLAALKPSAVADAYFGPDHVDEQWRNALTCDWTNTLREISGRYAFGFLNPPFSLLPAFMRKVWQESQRGARIVCVLPQKTETVWYHDVAVHADAIRQLRARLPYVSAAKPDPGAKNDPAFFPSSVMVFDGLAPVFSTGPRMTWWDVRGVMRTARTDSSGCSFSGDSQPAAVAGVETDEVCA